MLLTLLGDSGSVSNLSKGSNAPQLGIWNSLPASLRQPDIEFGHFKRLLKAFLFGETAVDPEATPKYFSRSFVGKSRSLFSLSELFRDSVHWTT